MHQLRIAIVYLSGHPMRRGEGRIDVELMQLRGVWGVSYVPTESIVAIRFDPTVASVSEVVRCLEDMGVGVSGLAQRSGPTARIVRRTSMLRPRARAVPSPGSRPRAPIMPPHG